VILEPAAQALADPPAVYELSPAEARRSFDELQAGDVDAPPVDDRWVTVGDVRVRIVRPHGSEGTLPVVVYAHGGGWMVGDAGTHDRFVRLLAAGTGAAVLFVEYTRSPEAHYPVAVEQVYATARWVTTKGATEGLDPARMAVAGDSAGGNLAAAVAILAQRRGDVRFVHQSMYYPVTDARQDYHHFVDGPYHTARSMAWFWDNYAPDPRSRSEITASPNQATLDELRGLPPAFVCVAEADVLRDEGEAYAAKLRAAGVEVTTVRYDGICHDFLSVNLLRDTQAARAGTAQAIAVLRDALA
jgi:acetyl esterase